MKDLTKTSKGSTIRIGKGLRGTMANTMRMLTLSVTLVGLALIITACGDDVQNRPPATTAATLTHKVADANVQYFVATLYGELISHNCVNCHATNESKSDQPFADPNNPNVAYNSAVSMLGMDPTTLVYLKGLDITDPPAPPSPATIFQSKVSGGHQPWTGNPAADGDKLGLQIVDWATLVQTDGLIDDQPDDIGTNESKLVAPPDGIPMNTIFVDLNDATSYNTHKGLFQSSGLRDLLLTNCSNCHSTTATSTQASPYFADASWDVAFTALIQEGKVDLNNTTKSRIFFRVAAQSHNCWTSDCGSETSGDGLIMITAINNWAAGVGATAFEANDDTFNNSRALFLRDGQVTSGGARYDRWVVAKYEFTEGSGLVVNDSSGVAPLLPLTLSSANNCTWLSNYGVKFNNNCRARSQSVAQSLKLYDQIVPRGEYTIEAWIIPDNEAQEGPAVVASYSAGSTRRNFTMGQSTEYYDFANRNSGMSNNGAIVGASDQNAAPQLSTDDGYDDTHIDHVVKANLQHLVMTYDTLTGRKIYVDGTPVLCETQSTSTPSCLQVRAPDNINVVIGNILTWNPGYLFTLGSETNGDNQWLGTIRMVAIHNRALTQEQIKMNSNAGVGQKFNLLFSVGSRDTNGDGTNDVTGLSGVPDNSYIWFQVSQYDYYSYLFTSPKFIVLDNDYKPTDIPTSFSIERMRIGLNGKEPAVGQAYSRMGPDNVKMPGLIDGSNYVQGPPTASGDDWTVPPTWNLSSMGTVIALENGINYDQFFLTFELIASAPPKTRQLGDPATLSVTYSVGPDYVVGLRTFNEISAAMAELTGIDPGSLPQPRKNKIAELKLQLPTVETMESFISSQQMAIANLAGIYCQELVEDTTDVGGNTRRAQYFGFADDTFFRSNVATAFTAGNQAQVVTVLTSKIAGQVAGKELLIQPAISEIKTQIDNLITDLITNCDGQYQDCSDENRTRSMVKAMCMAVLGSAAVTHQ